MIPDMKDLYWLAGILEGEGSFVVWVAGRTKRRPNPKGVAVAIKLAMTDGDVVTHAAHIFNMPHLVMRREFRWYKGAQDLYRLNICGSYAIEWMMTLYSLMGTRRRAQIRRALTAWRLTQYSRPKLIQTVRARHRRLREAYVQNVPWT